MGSKDSHLVGLLNGGNERLEDFVTNVLHPSIY